MTWLRELWTQLWITLVIAVVILALYTSLGRQLAPLVETWKPDAEAWLSAQIGQPVSIGTLRGGWSLLSPLVTVTDLQLGGAQGIQIERLEAELDVSASLFWQQPVFRRIDVQGVRAHLRQHSARSWQLSPDWLIHLPDPDPAPDDSRPRWLTWLELQQAIVLSDWQLTSLDIHDSHDEMRIEQLAWRNRGMRHELSGHLIWGREELAGIRLMGSLEGPLWPWQQQQGEIYLEVDEQEWSRWIPDALPGGLQISRLRAGAKGWLSVRNGDLQALYLDARLAALELHTRGETLNLNDGQLLLAGQHSGDDWHLRLQPTFAESLPFSSLSISSVSLPDSKGWQLGIPQADMQELRTFLQRYHFLPDNIAPYIEGTQAQGLASDIRLSFVPGKAGNEGAFDVRATLDEISTQAYRGIPAFTGVSGELHLNAHGGALHVNNDELMLHLSDLYPTPWMLEGVSGTFRWQLNKTLSVLQLEQFRASLQHTRTDQPGVTAWPLTASLRIALPTSQGKTEPSLSLLLGLPQGPVSLHEQLVPELAGQEVKDWIARSLQQGNVRKATFALQTVLSAEHPRNSTSTRMYLEFAGMQLQYQEGWPLVEQLEGRLLLDSPQLDVWLDQGRTLGGQLVANSGRVRLRTTEDSGPHLEVSARLSGDSGEALEYFTRTPLRDTVNNAFDEWQASGSVQAGLLLSMALGKADAVPVINLSAELADNRLRLDDLNLELTSVQGNLNYSSEKGLSSERLSGRVLGGDFNATIRSEIPQPGALNIALNATGAAAWRDFRRWTPLFLLEPVSGDLRYEAGLQVSGSGVQFRLSSDLQGTAIDLPYPMGKTADTPRPLEVMLQPGDGLRMNLRYNGLVNADLLLTDGALQRGQIRLGGQSAVLPDEPGLEIRGQLASELIAEEWWDTWQRISRAQESATAPVVESEDEAETTANPLKRIDLTLGEVLAWGVPLGVTGVRGTQTSSGWDFTIDSTLMRGTIQLPHAREPLNITLDYLHLPGSEAESEAAVTDGAEVATVAPVVAAEVADPLLNVNPALFPAADVRVAEVFVGGRQLGSWTFRSRPVEDGLNLELTDSDLHGLKLRGNLSWLLQDGQHSTRLTGLQFNSKNIGQIQRGFRQPPVIEGKDLDGRVDLLWQGSPMAFNTATLNGTAGVQVKEGLLVAESGGALKAFGVLNFNSMSRRLKLDFSDLYKSGVSFDVLRGKARIENGILTFTEPLVIDGPGGRFQTSGSTDLQQETLDMKLAVTFPVTSSLPIVAVLAGFAPPVAASIYVTEKLIGDELSRFTSASYDVRGTWQEPDMKIKRAFDNKVEGTQKRGLKQRILSIFGADD